MIKTIPLGSLYLDGMVTAPGSCYNPGQSIRIGDSVVQNKIGWMTVNGLLVPSQCLLVDISWDDLDEQGLVFGQEIMIDGLRFRCRLLKVGAKKQDENEWDMIRSTIGYIDLRDDPGEILFWGQETFGSQSQNRMVRGFKTGCWGDNPAHARFYNVGYLPVLEPVTTEVDDGLIGADLMILTNGGNAVIGRLVDHSEYDLLLTDGACITGRSAAISRQRGITAVDRSKILAIQTYERA